MASTSTSKDSPTGASSSSGGGLGVRSGKGGGAARPQSGSPGVTRPGRPTRSSGDDRTGSPGFTEDETKAVAVSSGGGLATAPEHVAPEQLSEHDPDHQLRGEDQLVDGVSEVVQPESLEEE